MDHKVEVIKIAPHLGAEIRGIDLSRELTDQEFEAVHAAFVEYEVVVLHGQKIVAEQHIAFGQRFSELSVHLVSLLSDRGCQNSFVNAPVGNAKKS